MRIVDVCAFYSPLGGGVRTYVQAKLAAGPKLGHEILILAPGSENRTEHFGPDARIEYIAAAKLAVDRRYHYFDDQAALHAALDRLEPDHLEVSSPWRSPTFAADWKPSVPRSLIMHCDPLSAYAYRWLGSVAERDVIDLWCKRFWTHLRRLGQSYGEVVCASPSLANRMIAGGVQGVVTNPMGVSSGIFSPRNRDLALRSRLLARCGLDSDATLLVAAGRLSSEKRWPMIIEACTAAGVRRKIALVLIGDGPQASRARKAVAGNPHILLLSPVTDRSAFARILASGDILIHGCEAETFSMITAEARASGLPLIVPDAGGAFDQANPDRDEIYAAADTASVVRAILQATGGKDVANRRRAADAASKVRTMDDHFLDLFASYARQRDRLRHAA